MLEEVWMHAMGSAADVVQAARVAEAEGWDGLLVPGSPLFVADPWVAIALAAAQTSRIAFGTGVATPAPQVAGALAGSSTTVQQAFPGRVVLGLGRGDRAAASFGLAPMPPRTFERYVARTQSYLRGEPLAFDVEFDGGGLFPPVDSPGAPGASSESRLALYMTPSDVTQKVPLEVFASGPKVIGIGARHADRLMLAVGAEPDRIRWATTVAAAAMDRAGRDPEEVTFGAMVTICAHRDRTLARELVLEGVASMARFSAMRGQTPSSVPDSDREIYRATDAAHGTGEHLASNALTADFVDRFAVIGTVKECVDQLEELVELGLRRFAFGFPAMVPLPDRANESSDEPDRAGVVGDVRATIVDEVLPEVRARSGAAPAW